MTEAERYEKTVYRGPKKGDVNAKSSKKMSKQERWLQCVSDAAETAPAELRPHFERMAMLDNVPFKPKQFRNFAMNSLPRGANQQKTIDDMWNLLKGNFDKEMEKVNSQNQGGQLAKRTKKRIPRKLMPTRMPRSKRKNRRRTDPRQSWRKAILRIHL